MDTTDPYRPPEGRVEDVVEHGADSPLAERLSRLLAQIVDGLIVGVPAFALMFAALAMGGESAAQNAVLLVFALMALAFGVNLYFLADNGQTIGKRVIGIKIVRLDRSRAGVGRILLLRMIAPGVLGAVPLLGFIFSIANILFIFREDRRCIHDWMADTVVVKA